MARRNPNSIFRNAGFRLMPVLAFTMNFGCSDPESSDWSWGGRGGEAGAGQGGEAGTGGVAGKAGQGTSGAPTAGSAGVSETGGTAGAGGTEQVELPDPHVAILSPKNGEKLQNPVKFSFEAKDVTSVALIADGKSAIALSWDPIESATHSMSYEFSTLGKRSLSLHGYLEDEEPAATHTIDIEISPPPLCDGFDTKPLIPPSVCNTVNGNTTSEIPSNNLYATSWFGCYKKSDGTIQTDPYDNCEFACGTKGLCSYANGPKCQAELQWFAADADRFGCGGRIRVTNCSNSKSVVLVALDRGPNCKSVEQKYGAPTLDMSHPAMVYLFDGKTYGASDKKRVIVESVPESTKLGPVQ